MTALSDWIDACCAELSLDRADVDERLVLDLTRDVAHAVDRPAAPVTAFLLGIAIGRGASPAEAVRQISALTSTWSPPGDNR